ncbi:hypothetical protein [Allosphingosinicella deserti]|uniref:Uncharacterized protein n=1 Tax=Allosphingosinicella deserti TaxID=2116704 RepID=A0A2P7QE51_9SPHN|nr:hypothetical protein [Sphingomonas deserti]PSJ36252.1 hypothetical protein C7I55_27080 [Sphingomonas deserti]
MQNQPGDYAAQIPPELQQSVERHQRHLAALVGSLRAAGVGEEMIEASVHQLLDSYRNELTDAMRAMVKDQSCG